MRRSVHASVTCPRSRHVLFTHRSATQRRNGSSMAQPPGQRSPPGMSGGSRLTPGGEQVMERARRPPSSRGRRSRRVSAAPLLEGAAEELLHALVRARARDEVPPRRLIGSPGPRSSLSTSPFYHPRRYLRPISPRRAEKVGFVPNKCQIRVDGATAPKKRKAKGVPF